MKNRLTLLKQCLQEGQDSQSMPWLALSILIMVVSAAAFGLAPILLGRWIELIRVTAETPGFVIAFAAYLLLYAVGYLLRDAQWSTYSRFERLYFVGLTRKIYRENLAAQTPRTESEIGMGLQGAQGFLFSTLFLVLPYGLEALAAVISIIAAVSLKVGACFVVFCLGYVALLQWSTKKISGENRQFFPAIQRSLERMQSFLNARALIRRSHAADFSETLLMDRVKEQEQRRVHVADMRTKTSVAVNLWVLTCLCASLFLTVRGYRNGEITFGALVATESFFFQIMRRLEIWARGFRESAMYADQVQPILQAPEQHADKHAVTSWKDSLAYRNGEPGWTVIHGATGSGKSTLLKSWADRTENEGAYAGQFPEVLPLSIAENLSMGRAVDTKRIKEVLERLDLDRTIQRLPDGLATILEDGGAPLSGGELQRVCLARAILQESPTVFLDEPTSHQPEAREEALMRQVVSLLEGKRVICISHREHTRSLAQQILECEPFGKLRV